MLRDPIDRWCSGITQYLYNSKQDLSADEIFDKITFDDHTDLQTYFLQGVDLDKTTFMLVNNNLKANLNNWIYNRAYRTNVDIAIEYNASGDDDRRTTKEYYVKLLEQNPDLVLKLQQYFEADYKLIGSVKFYET